MSCPLLSTSSLSSHATPTTEIYTLSLHDALPIFSRTITWWPTSARAGRYKLVQDLPAYPPELYDMAADTWETRSEEHTSELQSPCNLVCRLLLEKKNKN